MNKDEAKVFKGVIEDIVNAQLAKYGITKYISAIVQSINSNGTVNVYIPPDETQTVSSLLNKTGEILNVGDSVEICTKNGKMNNAWIALKHGTNVTGTNALASYPVGSIYLSLNNTNPSQLFGGKWEQIKDRFLLACGDTYQNGSIGGSDTHKHGNGTLYACIEPRNTYGNTLYKIKEQDWTISHYSSGGRETISNTSGAGRAVDVDGETSETTILPPYLAVYAFRRTA